MSDVAELAKRVTWAELFFDLVFVFAVTQVTALLEHDPTWAGALRAFIVFVPVYWVWVGATIQANQQDVTIPERAALFAVALAGMLMALALPDAYENRAVLFAVAYWAARGVLGLRQVTTHRVWTINPVTVSIVLTGPLLVIGALAHGSAREAIWGAAAFIDLASPTMLRRRLRGMHFDAGHLAERFGLFVLIAMGESVVAIGAAAGETGPLAPDVGVTVGVAFAVACGLWWVYFNFAADAVRHALATATVQLDVARLVLSYGHLAFIASIIGVAVGLREAVGHPGDELGGAGMALLYGAAALYLAAFGYTRWMMFRLVSTTRLTASAAVLVAWPVAARLPAVWALVVLGVVLLALNVVEWRLANEVGFRAALARRSAPEDRGSRA